MQELKYQLEKEDYLDWIHWNVARHSMKKMKIISAVVYAAFFLIYVGSSIMSKKEPMAIVSSVIMVLLLGAFMFYIISPAHQEKMIWKRSGLKKLEKTKGFPTVNLAVREDGITMEVPDQVCKDYPYTDITEFEETPRLYLLGTSDRVWQFVAKSAFSNTQKAEEFKEFMLEKIADAKENPEKYRKEEVASEEFNGGSQEADNAASSESSFTEDEPVIMHVDTSGMGKIGKMANLIAAMSDGGEDETEQNHSEEPNQENKKSTGESTDGDTLSRGE